LFKSFKNLKNSNLVSVEKLAAIDVISADDLIFSKNALDKYCGEEA
jgi:ribosomal protein L4